MFSVRIFSVDHYMTSPTLGLDPTYSHFRGKEVKQVPILRIFGANPKGHKTCLHVHGVFPYLHIPHDETSLESTEKLCYHVATSLDKAINILMGQSDSNTQHVFDITPVAGIPLYGYHNQKHQFLKIRFFNPFTVKKAATLLQNGTILDRIYQPHDAHINYELQFMIDFNLHGMNNIYLSDIKYRIDDKIDSSVIDDIPSQQILNKNVTRISTCKYEIDCLCENILNLNEVTNGHLSANPGIAAIWEEERQRRQLQDKDTQDIAPTASQFRAKLTETNSEIFFKNRLRDRLDTLKNSNVSSVPSLNQSIYPSEVSDPNQFLNASVAHLVQNSEVSLSTPIKKSELVVNESLILSLTQEDKKQPINHDIYNVLVDLIDEDSILSQHPLNELTVVLDDEIEQESHDLEQTLIEDNEIFSSNEKKSESIGPESNMMNEIFSSNDSFLKHVNVSQLEQNIGTDLDRTAEDNYSEDTLVESEKCYSIFYDDIMEIRKIQPKSTPITFSQFSDDILDAIIEDNILKIEKSHDEKSIIYSSDSDELIFDGKWKRIPQIDGATIDLKEKSKRERPRHLKNDHSGTFREFLCEYTGMLYKIDPIVQPKLPKKTKKEQEPKTIKNQKQLQAKVKVLKVEKNTMNVEDLTKSINYMPVSFQGEKSNETYSLNVPLIENPNEKINHAHTQQFDELLNELDYYLSMGKFENSTVVSQNKINELSSSHKLNTTYPSFMPENNDDSITRSPVDVCIKQRDNLNVSTIETIPLQELQKSPKNDFINFHSKQCIDSIKEENDTILDRLADDNYFKQGYNSFVMNNFHNNTFDIKDDLCIKGLLSEMINAIAPNETYNIFPELLCNSYHKMKATFSGKNITIDMQCRFLQNVRECFYNQILNPTQPFNVPYILKLNYNFEPISVDAYDPNQLPTIKNFIIDKEKFSKSVIYDNSFRMTDQHTVFCKNGKIVIKENVFHENVSRTFQQSKSYNEFNDYLEKKIILKKANIIGHPWHNTKNALREKVHSSPTIVIGKKQNIKKKTKLNNLKGNWNPKSKNVRKIKSKTGAEQSNLELNKHLKINQTITQLNNSLKTDMAVKKPNDFTTLKIVESENKNKDTQSKLNEPLKSNDITFEKFESKTDGEEIATNIICNVPNSLISRKKFENNSNIDASGGRFLQNMGSLQCTVESGSDFTKNTNRKAKISNLKNCGNKNNLKSLEVNMIPNCVTPKVCEKKDLIQSVGISNNMNIIQTKKLVLNKCGKRLTKSNKKSSNQLNLNFNSSRNSTIETYLETFTSYRTIKENEDNIIIIVNNNNDSKYIDKMYNLPEKTLNERWSDGVKNKSLETSLHSNHTDECIVKHPSLQSSPNNHINQNTVTKLANKKNIPLTRKVSSNSHQVLALNTTLNHPNSFINEISNSLEKEKPSQVKNLKSRGRKRRLYSEKKIKTVKLSLGQNFSENNYFSTKISSDKMILKPIQDSNLVKPWKKTETTLTPRVSQNCLIKGSEINDVKNLAKSTITIESVNSRENCMKKKSIVPGIDGIFDITDSLDECSTDSSVDDNNELIRTDQIIFVDGLNSKTTVRDKYKLRECSVVLTRCDANTQVTTSNKRRLCSKPKELKTSNVVQQSNKKCRYSPLDIVLTKSPTSRGIKNDQHETKIKNARKRLKLNFDDHQSCNENVEEKQSTKKHDSSVNFQSSTEIGNISPQCGSTGEFSVQDFELQPLEVNKVRGSLKLNQNKKVILTTNFEKNKNNNLQNNNQNNVIQNVCDNSSNLVCNSVINKNRRSLRNRTLMLETKKNIVKHSKNSLKISTSAGKTTTENFAISNSTFIEESKGCTFSTQSIRKLSLINVSQIKREKEITGPVEKLNNYLPKIDSDDSVTTPSPEIKIKSNSAEIESDDSITIPSSEIKIKNNSPELDSDDSITIPSPAEINRDYISPSPEQEVKLLISPEKTVKNYTNALEYDIKNNFFPQPGCSTVKGDNLSCENDVSKKAITLVQYDSSQSLHSENCEKLPPTQTSECDVESFYDITFGDCTKFGNDGVSSNPKSNSSIHCAQNITEFDLKPSQSTEMHLSGLSFQSDAILTQTPNQKLNTLNLTTIEFEKVTKRLTNGCVILMPKFNPPSYDDIKNSAADYKIPEIQYENPFYSIPTDATGRIEIGHKILKVPTKCVQDLPEFTSNLEFDSLNVWRQRKIDIMQVQSVQNLVSNREILITPNIKPPSLRDVEVWLKAKNYLKEIKSKRDESIKIKIRIPSSPGGDGNDSDDGDSLTLTPCTPKNELFQTPSSSSINTSKKFQNSAIQTPTDNFLNTSKSTPIRPSPSMIHKSTKHILKNKRVRVSLAKSFNKSQDSLNVHDPSVTNLLNDPQFRKDLNSPLSNSSCLITGVTLDNTHGFKVPLENFQNVKALIKHQYLTTIILELHIKSREDFKPNPQLDSILAIFYSIYNDVPESFELPQSATGIICVGPKDFLIGTYTDEIEITYVESELQLFDSLIKLFTKWDPDILAGYEICRLSWGYLLERSFYLQLNLPKRLSRIPESRANTRIDENGKMSDIHFTGRLFLEIWRLMRHEIDLYSYSFENVVFHILHERIPKHSFKNLCTWFESTSNRYITVQYYLKRVTGVLSILDQLDFIGRTSELARLFGIQFFEVLSRGSQFRVESMMLRLTKPLNYIPVSPSVTQRAKMKAPEFLPLIMEPDSRLYNDPIIVLDFQSLYPSMIIAYNYCFSTCLGRVKELGQSYPFEFGATQLRVNPKLVEAYLNNNKLNISPCGVAFVNNSVRQGILPRMLKEILDCRLMVKKSLKENKDDTTLKRVLNSRQLGLKLIANVTYGYTAANFSGRMPCCELGDSVVSKGRETLERAIQMVEKNEKWGAKVVYGDTDSLFVMTPGRSRKDAFQIGKEIAEAVTNDNPTPVKLKLEKIYQPCILQTKKRYVGYMYESPDQEEPIYNAKGIETVRRDGCPAVAKILEKTLRILFETKDMSIVKQYVCRQFSKIITGRINLQDLIFAREFRGLNGYRPGAMVPALELAKRYKMQDPRNEPLRSERVPYVIASGAPGTTLIRLAKGPHELLAEPALKPHIQYYITKVIIPPLNRCLSLCGVDVHMWYKDLPRKYKLYFPSIDASSKDAKKSTIAQHFATTSCVSCGVQTRDIVCSNCIDDPQKTVTVLGDKIRKWERNLDNVRKICFSCCGRFEETQCISLDCSVLYRLTQAQRDCEQAPFVRNALFTKILIDVQSESSADSDNNNSVIEMF